MPPFPRTSPIAGLPMRHRLSWLSASALLVLCACSGTSGDHPSQTATAVATMHAEHQRLEAQGSEATAREITALEYPAYRELMRISGLDAVLGDENRADAALRELFAGYEQRVRSLEDEMPKMLPMAYTGMEIGYSGFAASMLTGNLQNQAAVSAAQRAAGEGKPTGSHSHTSGGSTMSMEWSQTQSSSTTEFEGAFPGGLKGKVSTKVKVDTCPDASGKINIEFTSNSELRSTTQAGTGGFIKVSAKMSRSLDDDAHLIDDQMDAEVHVEQKAFDNYEGAFVDVTYTLSTTRGEVGTRVNHRGGKANDASVQGAEGIAKMGLSAAMQALDAAKQAWESGACVDLQATSSPSKRKGVTPGTRFQIDAKPRARADDAPTGGTVRATLSGGQQLDPSGGKIPADAKYTYVAPDKKDESASIEFESRSKRGVGRATLEFDTKQKRAYHAVGGGGQFHGSGTICDLEEPFTITGSGVTMTFTPSSAQGGSYSYQGNMSGFAVWGGTSYTVSANENGGSMTGTGSGCVRTPMGTRCANGTEKYTLTPTDPCE